MSLGGSGVSIGGDRILRVAGFLSWPCFYQNARSRGKKYPNGQPEMVNALSKWLPTFETSGDYTPN